MTTWMAFYWLSLVRINFRFDLIYGELLKISKLVFCDTQWGPDLQFITGLDIDSWLQAAPVCTRSISNVVYEL